MSEEYGIVSARKVYLVAGKRTPFGRFGGGLAKKTPVDLAQECAQATLESINLLPKLIDHVIFANVVPSSTDTLYAGRHLGLRVGAPITTPAYNVNRLCGSGIQVILDANKLIKFQEAECVLVSGSENMSMTPHLTYGGRFGTKYGNLKSVDMLLDALTDQHCQTSMGITAENLAKEFSIGRELSDEYSFNSHKKCQQAYEQGFFDDEIIPVQAHKKNIIKDEHLRSDISLAQMQALPATFQKNGVVTAGSASGVVDGAAAAIIASEEFCLRNKLTPLAEIIDGTVVGVEPTLMGIGPSPAIKLLLERNKMGLDDINLVEINEAFAPQILACAKDLNLSLEKTNIWGGAIAMGHPLGTTGVRISLTLARQLKQTAGTYGIASACIGGGQGISLLLKSC